MGTGQISETLFSSLTMMWLVAREILVIWKIKRFFVWSFILFYQLHKKTLCLKDLVTVPQTCERIDEEVKTREYTMIN
jgi:hypothetical protein